MLQIKILLKLVLLSAVVAVFAGPARAYYVDPQKFGSPAGEVCVICHREATPGIYYQWEESAMGQAGVNCYDCHKAEKTDPDAFEHKEFISIVVTPKDCSRCHDKEFKEFESSHHADAVNVLNSSDMFLGKAIWGSAAERSGCISCHGSILKVRKDGKLDPATWPNTGIGRINPDKSKGSCTACHTRHIFSREQARRPETCGRCHSGPDSPQVEVYHRSKHGLLYHANRDKMNMDKRRWRAGQDYFQAPTCATCHMSAVPPQMVIKDADQRLEEALKSLLSGGGKEFEALVPPEKPKKIDFGASHDVGSRLSWSLGATISKKRDRWEEKRKLMQSVCTQCHSENFYSQFYVQLDGLVELYNKEFAVPATNMRKELIKEGELTQINYDDELDRIYWKLLQHSGNRAKFGKAMVGPSFFWQQGMQEVAEDYYMEFVPEVRNLTGRKAYKFLRDHGYSDPRLRK